LVSPFTFQCRSIPVGDATAFFSAGTASKNLSRVGVTPISHHRAAPYAGLELFGLYLRQMRFNALVRKGFRGSARWGDYGVVAMVRVLVGLLVVGGRRVRHVAYVADDPLFRRFTDSAWIARLSAKMCCPGSAGGPSRTPSKCRSTRGWICRRIFDASPRGRG
jgi:hypothetical protein